jgi:cytochrome b subunit of formate dehydrogenase
MLQPAQEAPHGTSRPYPAARRLCRIFHGLRSRRRAAGIFPIALVLLAFPLSSHVRAQQLDEETCAACHASDQTETDGQALPAVTPALFKGTPHQAIGCTSCHEIDPAAEVPEGRTAHKLFSAVDCSLCHQSSRVKAANQSIPILYRQSVHGIAKLGKQDPRAPRCQNCHGSHRILPPADAESRVSRKNITSTCASCHVDRDDKPWQLKSSERVKAYAFSIHGKFNQAFANLPAAVCTDCHGEHDIAKVSKKESYVDRYKLPQTCSKCHQKIVDAYRESVHGKLLAQGNADVPTCTSCHGEHTIAKHSDPNSPVYSGNVTKTCSACHQNALLSSRYKMPPNRQGTYQTSFHGIAHGFGDTRAANCASCHGSHDILPSSDPKSRVNPKNLGETCGSCHSGPTQFVALGKIHQNQTFRDNPLVFLIKLFYLIMIIGTVGGFIAYIVLDLFSHYARRLFARLQGRDPEARHKPAGKVYLRFPLSYRVQHIIMMLSFLTLIFTGLPILFPESSFFKAVFNTPGSFELRGLIHRGAALVLIALTLVHAVFVLTSRRGRKDVAEMMPRIKDYKDFRKLIAFNLGRSKERPAYPRFNFIEKFEYLAVVWGSFIMILTGFLLWFPGWTMRHMPKLGIDIAAAIHGYEAALAFLAIIIWHLYSVIFSPEVWPMSKVWLTGELTEAEMEHHHPLELEKLKETDTPPKSDSDESKK